MIQPSNIDGFRAFLEKKGLKKASIDSYCSDARGFLEYQESQKIPFGSLEPDTLALYLDVLATGHKDRPNSIRRKVIGIKQYYRFLTEVGALKVSPFDENVIPARLEVLPEIESLVAFRDHISSALPATHIKEARDYAALSLLALEGLKVGELIGLEWGDLIGDDELPSLRVPGPKARTIYIDKLTLKRLRTYKTFWNKASEKSPLTKMFVGFKGREASLTLSSVTRHGLKHMLYELGDSFGIKRLNTETLRHIAIDHQIHLGKSGEQIMAHFGLKRMGNITAHLRKGE